MARESTTGIAVGLIAAVAVFVAAYQANVVFAPLTLGLFIIALAWPLQDRLQQRMPAILALAITMTVSVAVMLAFASLAIWGFGRVGRSVIADAGRYQRSMTQPSPGSTVTACRSQACGRSISMWAGCCAGRSRSPGASTRR